MTRRNPDDRSLLSRLSLLLDDDPRWAHGKKGRYVTFYAMLGKNEVGRLDLRVKRLKATPSRVDVLPAYRRKGVASWLYQRAGEALGRDVTHSGNMTTDGRAFRRGRRS